MKIKKQMRDETSSNTPVAGGSTSAWFNNGDAILTSMAFTPDQTGLILAGYVVDGSTKKMAFAKFKTSAMTQDSTFGNGGQVVINGVGGALGAEINDLAMTNDGKFYAVGKAHNGTIWEPLIVRMFQ